LRAFSDRKITLTTDPKIAMSLAITSAKSIFPALIMKEMNLLKAPADKYFITSDHPVVLLKRSDVPPYFGGFVFSDVFFPLGRSCALYMSNPEIIPEPENFPKTVVFGEENDEKIEMLNGRTLFNAERFLFGSENNSRIKEKFDLSEHPTRFTVN